MSRYVALALALVFAACAGGDPQAAPEARGMASADYDRWRQPERVIAALDLSEGDAVADVGAGRGYLTYRLARAVGPRGRVTATDIDPGAVRALAAGAAGPDAAPIEARLVEPADPGLEPGAYDRVVLAQVDHLLDDRAAYLRALRAALAPGGRVAVQNRVHHRAGLLAAAGDAGYAVVSELTDLPGQYLVLLDPNPEASP